MSELVEKLHTIHDALTEAGMPHAFGGAIALAYCVEEPRGTRDLDVNVFVEPSAVDAVLQALPPQVKAGDEEVAQLRRDAQSRLDWDGTPVDIFLNNLPLHDSVAGSVVWVRLEGRDIPILDCASLVVFKALFDRTKDWADIEAVSHATPEDIEMAVRTIEDLVGGEDPAYSRLASILAANPL